MRFLPLARALVLIGACRMCVYAQPPIAISVCDDAAMPKWVMTEAIETARMAFLAARMETRWMGCDTAADLEIRVMPRLLRPVTPHGDRMGAGYAMPFGFAIPRAYAFYTAVATVANRTGQSIGAVLGCVWVHEVGHLLGLRHGQHGAMRGNLEAGEIDAVTAGRAFNLDEIRRLGAGARRASLAHLDDRGN